MVNLYRAGLRPLLFSGLRADPETVHQRFIQACAWIDQHPHNPMATWARQQSQRLYCLTDSRLAQTLWGLTFVNPLGLAAGFDKNGVASNFWSSLGFGFAEVGTVTYHAQPGNPRPRLFRLPQDRAAINRMGFNNAGAQQMAGVLATVRASRPSPAPLGINLGKSKITPLAEAASDYRDSFRLLKDYGDYFVVNVSSPNTPGLRSLQASAQLEPILATLQAENTDRKPLLVKIAPDLAWDEIEAIVQLAQTHHLAGIIATNTTIDRQGLRTAHVPATGKPPAAEAGGLSGAPVRERSTEIIRWIWQHTQGELPIIGVGGIFTAADAWAKLAAGASLLQLYTGWTYEGPGLVRQILAGLLQQLDKYGYETLADAIAHDHRRQTDFFYDKTYNSTLK